VTTSNFAVHVQSVALTNSQHTRSNYPVSVSDKGTWRIPSAQSLPAISSLLNPVDSVSMFRIPCEDPNWKAFGLG
jgi:hypothetical protein